MEAGAASSTAALRSPFPHSRLGDYSVDHDEVRIIMLLGPLDDSLTVTWIGPMPRWRARDVCRDFAYGVEWEGRPVVRALIVP